MNFWKNGAATLALTAVAGAAHADFSSTVTLTNDYDFRGFSQSAKDFAFQASADWAAGDTGWAFGAWASNVDFGPSGEGYDSPDIELDLYAGYTGSYSDTLGYTAGAVVYSYPSSSAPDSVEVYYGLTFGEYFSAKQWYSWNQFGSGENGFYTEANATYPLGDQGFSILAHIGYSWGDYWSDVNGSEILDYGVGFGYSYSNFNLAAKYIGTDASGDQKITDDVFNNEGRFVITIATTLPW